MDKNIGIQDKAVSSLADITTATALCLYYSYIIASLPPFTCDLGVCKAERFLSYPRFYRRCTTCKLRLLTKGSRGCVPGAPDASVCAYTVHALMCLFRARRREFISIIGRATVCELVLSSTPEMYEKRHRSL